MDFSIWRKDGIGNRYAVSRHSIDAIWVPGYIIQEADGRWTIEGDEFGVSYPTAEEAATMLISTDDQHKMLFR